jgi:hypothetical protein
VPTVGQGDIATLTVADGGVSTAASVAVKKPDRTAAQTVVATGSNGGVTWEAVVQPYTVSGLWWHVWTVTGAGAGVLEFPVAVEPREANAAAPPRSYATTTDLADYFGPGEPIPVDAEGKLHRATARIDRILKGSVYPVDVDGEPTEVAHQAALAEAVCEVVAWWVDMGDEAGYFGGGGGSASVGSISLSSLSRSGGKGISVGGLWIPQHAITVLGNAGLLGHAPWVY